MAIDAPVVVKIGGAVLDGLGQFWSQVAALPHPVVIVHGGGAQSTSLARRLGHTPRIVQGRRVTGDLDLAVAEWAMRGEVNLQLVAEGQSAGMKCVGLSGVDGGLTLVRKREPWTVDGEVVDFGWVGEIARIDPHVLQILLGAGYVPVIAPIGLDREGRRYNVNADTVAGTLAAALNAMELLLVTDTAGLRRHPGNPDSLLTDCSRSDFEMGVREGWITGGMRVKLAVSFEALDNGVDSVYILGPGDLTLKRNATRVLGIRP